MSGKESGEFVSQVRRVLINYWLCFTLQAAFAAFPRIMLNLRS